MPAADLASRVVRRMRDRASAWVWLIGLAIAWGAAIVVFALTVHNRCSVSDPDCVFHSYTLVARVGPGIIGLAATPLVISIALATLLRVKTTRRSHLADRAAWLLAALNCLLCLVGLVIAGVVMLPEAALPICAVAAAPFPPISRRG